jgi:hypothetical protein
MHFIDVKVKNAISESVTAPTWHSNQNWAQPQGVMVLCRKCSLERASVVPLLRGKNVRQRGRNLGIGLARLASAPLNSQRHRQKASGAGKPSPRRERS